MPSLVNGCGTSYAGKKNLERHPGTCDFCRASGMLQQYDTRLCVTILFIPVVPFRRLRVIDECQYCRRHRVVRLREYEMNRQLGITAALADWRRNPGVENAVGAHQTMRAFRQQEQAGRFMRELQQRFHQDARLKAYHGTMLLEEGRKEEARLQLNEALKLRPDLAEARIPMARILMDDGDADGAFSMLEFMLHPGSSQLHSLAPLEQLALYLQSNHRYEQSLRIFRHLVEELPAVAQVPGFRATVARTESALEQRSSILPPKKFSMYEVLFGTRAKLTKWALCLVVAAVLFTLRNFWIAGHRTMYVVNAWPQPVELRLSPDRTVTAPPGRSSFTLAEGSYDIGVSGPVTETIPARIQAQFMERWTKNPVWVLVPGGAAVLIENNLSVRGAGLNRSGAPLQPAPVIHAGERFVALPDVNYPFKELPKSISLKNNETAEYHQILEFGGDLADAVMALAERNPDGALTTAHAALMQDPGDSRIVRALEPLLTRPELARRHEQFLRTKVNARPVSMEWHRTLQGTNLTAQRCTELAAFYDGLLQKEPDDSALVYLRGRVSGPGERDSWYRRALDRDAKNIWAHYGMAWQHQARGEYKEAVQHLEVTLKSRPRDASLGLLILHFRAAMDPRGVLAELAAPTGSSLVESTGRAVLLMHLAGAAKEDRIRDKAISNYSAVFGEEMGRFLMGHALYAAGNYKGTVSQAKAGGPRLNDLQAAALLADGQVSPAEALLPAASQASAADALATTIAWHLKGNSEKEKTWLGGALRALAAGDSDEALLARLLREKTAPALTDLQTAAVPPEIKALTLTVLAQRFPDHAAEYATLARRLAVIRGPHNAMVHRALSNISTP